MQKARGHTTKVLPPLVGRRFQVLFHSPSGVLFTFPSRYLSAIGHLGVLSLGGWSPQVRTAFHVCGPTQERVQEVDDFDYGTIALFGARFHTLRLSARLGNSCQTGHGLDNTSYNPGYATRGRLHVPRFGLIRFRSPLLTESRLIYFPRGTEMFHFPRLPPSDLCVQSAVTPHYERRVSPFGHLRITGCSAPTRSFSQPSTSFIGSRCQGIHHLPLLS